LGSFIFATMLYLFFKALHIIGFVSWFAGIFYIVRLFVYHREAWENEDVGAPLLRKQYHIMEKRLYSIIQTPAMFITWLGGIGMLSINSAWLQQPWMHMKLTLVLGLTVYHFSCGKQIKKLKVAAGGISSFGFRLYNELPTLVLIAVVMLAVWKNLKGLWLGLALLVGLGVMFFVAAKVYKRKRKKK
jgi:putative membrane protein